MLHSCGGKQYYMLLLTLHVYYWCILFAVSLVNPLSIQRTVQMNMNGVTMSD